MAGETGVTGTLTDGTGVSGFTVPKAIKDFIVDFLLTAAAGVAAAQVVDIPTNVEQAGIAVTAIATAFIKAGYRAALAWAQTP
jgi:hypothetical protein